MSIKRDVVIVLFVNRKIQKGWQRDASTDVQEVNINLSGDAAL